MCEEEIPWGGNICIAFPFSYYIDTGRKCSILYIHGYWMRYWEEPVFMDHILSKFRDFPKLSLENSSLIQAISGLIPVL